MGDFRQLQAWREAKTLVLLSRNAIRKLPPDERFALGDQWRRAAYSVALNIAEGASRRGPREFRRYLDIARSSLHELEGILELVELLEYLPREELANLGATRDTCATLVYGLLRTMARAMRRSLTTERLSDLASKRPTTVTPIRSSLAASSSHRKRRDSLPAPR